MKEKLFNKSIQDKEVKIYLMLFFIYLTLGKIVPVVHIIDGRVNSILSMAFAGIGALLLLQDFLTQRVMLKTKGAFVLVAFMAAIGISSVANMSYGITDNIKTMLWMCIQFFIIYAVYVRFEKEECCKFVENLFVTLNIIWVAGEIISLIQYVYQVGYWSVMTSESFKRQGFYKHRLFGVFSDPNVTAILAICLIAFDVYMFIKCKGIWKRCILVLSVIINYAYIILSGSRTALLCMYIVSVVISALVVKNISVRKKTKVLKAVICILAAMVIGGGLCHIIYVPAKKVVAVLPNIAKYIDNEEHTVSGHFIFFKYDTSSEMTITSDEAKEQQSSSEKNSGHVEVDEENLIREDTGSERKLNNRWDIWTGYMQSLKGSKFIVGLSPRNAIAYIKDVDPDNYIASTGYVPHSDYIALLSYTGLTGTVVFLIFIFMVVAKFLKEFFSNKEMSKADIFLWGCIGAIALFGVSYLEVLFANTLTAFIFWMAMSVVLNKKENNN